MSLTILSVAYPLAPVGPDAVGGAEQVLSILDRGLVAAGHRSIVVAPEGSVTAGRLVPTPAFYQNLDDRAKGLAEAAVRAAISRVLADGGVDLVHMHALDFDRFLPDAPVPVLASLHLPLRLYSHAALHPTRPGTWLHCVSRAQHAEGDPTMPLLPPIPNGVELDRFGGFAKRHFALFLGRICPEKGVHLAIEAARAAGLPLLIAGRVFAYDAHLDYFERQIEPRLGRDVRFLGPLGVHARRRVLAMARCLVIPSLIDETSSLVAREAAASGTAVVAFRRGALAETVVEGVTGYLVDDAQAMAEAIANAGHLDPAACRRHADEHFDSAKMLEAYLSAYRMMLGR